MTPTSSLANLTYGYRNTTTEQYDSKFCHRYTLGGLAALDHIESSIPGTVNAVLNVLMAITTTLANILVLLAMYRATSFRLASRLLLCTLVLTDLGTGLVVQPQVAVFSFLSANNYHSASKYLEKSLVVSATLFSCASLIAMVAISLDRYIALHFHLNYRNIVTTKRVCIHLTFAWSYAFFFASTFLWSRLLHSVLSIGGIFISSVIVPMAYIKIYRSLRGQHGHQVQPQAHENSQNQVGNTFNKSKFKKTASTMLWIYVVFILCYLPYLAAFVIIASIGCSPLLLNIHDFSYTIVLLSSCLNPFLCCLRMNEIRTEVMKQMRQICCLTSQQ